MLYETYISELQLKAASKKIWVSLDETTDSEQRLVANFVFGIFEADECEKSYLLNLAHIERANASSKRLFLWTVCNYCGQMVCLLFLFTKSNYNFILLYIGIK